MPPADPSKKPDDNAYAPAKFFPAKNSVLLYTENDIHLCACNVYDDGTLTYEVPKILKSTVAFKEIFKGEDQHRAVIFRPPHVFKIPFRETMPTWLGRRIAPEYMTFLAYSVNPRSNVTFDPSIDQDELDPEITAGFQALLQLKSRMVKVDWKAALTKGMEDEKGWKDYIWHITLTVQTVLFLVIFVLGPLWWG